ncbi:hypothetical protein N7474_009856 [Penicillium riverlandense]|uniref:uncharacterized protein n=1 Tax=Penicillium riverlandense TaxID=1903569 RepID=UPI0025478618|nr:uncharacterized protein N7474_009856 [Penicillium riverlandense]KAJ5808587.1 hypothetical protein N7474_009856 [Penicillium riverlandense]
MRAFVEYYMSQRVLIEAQGLNLHTHQDLIDLINFVRARIGIPQSQLVANFRKEYDCVGPALPAIEVAVRIWLLVSIDEWEPRQSLQEYICVLFPRIDPPLLPDEFAFPLSFNITNLRLIGGFEIVWTECLHDHLSFSVDEEQKKELKIFHLSSFLQGYRYSSCSIFPPGLLEETAQSLSLLFPSSNLKCQRWLRKARRREDIDLEAGLLPATSRTITQYPYWGRQLLELRDEYDRTEPTTVKQWIADKRNPNQRYTFWIAVVALALALVFGFIQSVTGILQVVQQQRR